ncbi:MAG TPA: U32 family peptidase [Burkholderiales bacterium]
MRLSLGPIHYFWERERVFEFYRQAARWPVDIVYLGEVVCSKRRELGHDDWLGIASELADAGKEVVLSTLALVEAASDLASMRRTIGNGRFAIEANDMAAVNMARGRARFVVGPHINCYNADTLEVLARAGATRWVPPIELDSDTVAQLHAARPRAMQTEVIAFSRLPLALSARCFTARAHNTGKDDCGLRCRDDPDGMRLRTQDGDALFTINGVQVLSARTCNLAAAVLEMKQVGIDVLRLSPQPRDMEAIVTVFRSAANGTLAPADAAERLVRYAPDGACNGYWHAQPGMRWVVCAATPERRGVDG